ncbi:hypothetical protein [Numidum massiliense]|nr:hypothetical protein [Numidum massiliense]
MAKNFTSAILEHYKKKELEKFTTEDLERELERRKKAEKEEDK